MKNIALVITTLILTIFCAEAMFRIVKPMPLTGMQIAACEEIIPDQRTGYRYRPNTTPYHERFFEYGHRFPINNLGYHDRMRKENSKTGLRILAVGDSFTAGMHVSLEASWTQVAENTLQADRPAGAPRIEVINGGLSGSGIDTQLRIIEDLAPRLRPDIVALMFLWNDLDDATYSPLFNDCYKNYRIVYQNAAARKKIEDFIDRKYNRPVIRFLVDHFLSVRALNYHARWVPVINVVHHGDVSLPWKLKKDELQATKSMKQFSALAAAHGFLPVVIPPPGKSRNNGEMLSGASLISEAAASCAIEVIDLRPEIRRMLTERGITPKDMFFVLDGHYDATGHEIFGIAFANAAKERVTSLNGAERSICN